MNRLGYIALIILLIPSFSHALILGYSRGSAPAIFTCIGWTTDCSLSTNPTDTYSGSADVTITLTWTATEGGTLEKVSYYYTDTWTAVAQKAVVYISGGARKATGTLASGTSEWVDSGTLVAESGQSLTFATNDVLEIGITLDTGGAYTISRTTNGGAANQWKLYNGYDLTSVGTPAVQAAHLLGVVLSYTPD